MSTPPTPPAGPGHSWPPPSPTQPWGPPPGYGQQQPQQPPPLNGFALASLLVGLLCLPPLGVVFGIVALVQIAGKRQRGRALAVVGLVVSVAMTVVMALAAGRVAHVVGERLDAYSALADAEGVLTDREDLAEGDCFNVPGGDLTGDMPPAYRIDCARPHHAEITSSEVVDAGYAPGTAAAERYAEDACWQAQDAYAMDTWAVPESAGMYYFAPSPASWRRGDRRLVCIIGTTEEEQRGSLRNGPAELEPEQVEFLEAANAVDFRLGAAPAAEPAEALAEHRAWAMEVYAALGAEAQVLERHRARPGLAGPVREELADIAVARALWGKAGAALSAREFEKQWELAAGAMPVRRQAALRGAYGLTATAPPWLEEGPGDGTGGPGRGPDSESV